MLMIGLVEQIQLKKLVKCLVKHRVYCQMLV